MKKESSRKLNLEKFKIAVLNNPEKIKGGTDSAAEGSSIICTL